MKNSQSMIFENFFNILSKSCFDIKMYLYVLDHMQDPEVVGLMNLWSTNQHQWVWILYLISIYCGPKTVIYPFSQLGKSLESRRRLVLTFLFLVISRNATERSNCVRILISYESTLSRYVRKRSNALIVTVPRNKQHRETFNVC